MTILFALALSIGTLAVVATWVFLGPLAALQVQIWQAFIAWAAFYHCGGKGVGFKNTLTGMIFGAAAGSFILLPLGAKLVIFLALFRVR